MSPAVGSSGIVVSATRWSGCMPTSGTPPPTPPCTAEGCRVIDGAYLIESSSRQHEFRFISFHLTMLGRCFSPHHSPPRVAEFCIYYAFFSVPASTTFNIYFAFLFFMYLDIVFLLLLSLCLIDLDCFPLGSEISVLLIIDHTPLWVNVVRPAKTGWV